MRNKTLAITGLISASLLVLTIILFVLLYRPTIAVSEILSAEISSPEYIGGKLLFIDKASSIKSFNPENGKAETILEAASLYSADFSPDGKRTVLKINVSSTDGDIETEPWITDLNTKAKVKIVDHQNGELLWIGAKLYLLAFDSTSATLREIDVNSGTAQSSVTRLHGYVGPKIVPNENGDKLLIQELHPSGAVGGLYLLDFPSGGRIRVSDSSDIADFAFSGSNTAFFLEDSDDKRRLVRYDLNSKQTLSLGFAADPDQVLPSGRNYLALLTENIALSEDMPLGQDHKIYYFKNDSTKESAISEREISGAAMIFASGKKFYVVSTSGIFKISLPLLT